MVRWRRVQIVLWSAPRMDVPAIARIAFTSEDRVREVIHNFNDPDFEEKQNQVLDLHAIADGTAEPERGDPAVIMCTRK